jgi:hypothetical protein
MISQADIEPLANRNAIPGSPVLSVYLDMDQSKAANLNRQFEAALNSMLGSLSTGMNPEEQSNFNLDAEPVRRYVAGLEARAKGVIVFPDASEDFFWTREIHVPLRNRARWTDTPYLVPLMEILDEYERYGVVLFDNLVALQRQAQSMLAAVGTEAGATRRAIEVLLKQNNRLLAEMDESRGAAKDAA